MWSVIVLLCLVLLVSFSPRLHGGEQWTYRTQPGDNLWDLSKAYLTSMRYWRRLQRLNGIDRPRQIPPGTLLRIPLEWLRIKPFSVTVLMVAGEVSLRSAASGTNASLLAGATLGAGDTLSTGADGNALLEFPDGTQLLLQRNSHLTLDTLNAYGNGDVLDIRLQLEQGRTESRVPPTRDPNSRYELRTPAATSGVRGTVFRMQMDAEHPLARTEVTRGKVAVGGGGRVISVPEGFGTVVEAGQPPTTPRPLLPPPALKGLAQRFERIPIVLHWPAVAGARGYRAQLGPRAQPKALLIDEVLSVAELKIDDLPDGEYRLRIRGIDAQGLEGLDATHAFTVDAHPLPPAPQSPPPGARTARSRPVLEWAPRDACTRYRLQLTRTGEFTSPPVDLSDLSKPRWSPEHPLPNADYLWRVSCAGPAGEYGPFSLPRRFTILPLPAAPTVDTVHQRHSEVDFQWHTQPPVRVFEYQLAQDPGFRRILWSGRLREPRLVVPRPKYLPIYLRLRSVTAHGIPGRYSTAQRILPPRLPFWARGAPLYTHYP